MLDAVALASALATVPFVSLGGPWHRAIDQEYLTKPPPGFPPGSPPQPLWPGGAKEKGGRFTPKGSFDTLYLCSDPTTAMLEVGAVFRPPKGPLISARRDPLTLTQAEGTLEAVLDLMNKDIQEALGTNEQELTGSWRTATNPPTHILGTAVQACGRILAIRSYSAKNEGAGQIIAVFTDHLPRFPPSFVEMIDSSGKLAQRLP
jgi:RES domain-containing protein